MKRTKRLLSALLAAVIVVTSNGITTLAEGDAPLPSDSVTRSASEDTGEIPGNGGSTGSGQVEEDTSGSEDEATVPADSGQDETPSGGGTDGEPTVGDSQQPEEGEAPLLSIRWLAEDGGIRLIAVLENPGADTAAEGSIRLDGLEAAALAEPLPEGITLEAAEDGAELRFSLSTASPELSERIVFSSSSADLTILVTAGDVSADFTGAGSDLAEYTFEGEELALQVDGVCNWTVDAAAEKEELLWEGDEPQDMRFTIALSPADGEDSLPVQRQTADFSIALPQPFVFLEGDLGYDEEARQITLDGAPAVTLEGLGENCALSDFSLSDGELSFSLERTAAENDPLAPLELTTVIDSGVVVSRQQETPAMLRAPAVQPAETDHLEETFPVVLEVRLTSIPYAGEDYAGEAAGTASLSLRAQSSIVQDQFAEAKSGSIFWSDGPERDFRPDLEKYAPALEFVETDEKGGPLPNRGWAEPTEAQLADMGMDMESLPKVVVVGASNQSTWNWSVAGKQLPTRVITTDIFGNAITRYYQWRVRPDAEVDNYMLVEVTQDQIDKEEITTVDQPGWYYMLLDSYSFDVTLRWGTRGEEGGQIGITDAILENLELHVVVSGQSQEHNLFDMKDDEQVVLTRDEGENPNHGTFTIQGIPKYNIDNTLISYTVEPEEGSDGKLDNNDLPELEEDWYTVTYDNSGTAHGNVTDKVHNGGHIYFTLSGETDYSATKVWLDGSAAEGRPDGVFQLWRYRAGQSYTTAAAVRDANGAIVETALSTAGNGQIIEFDIDRDGKADPLPKYDSEGYRYVYVVREYLEGDHAGDYEQVFAAVEQDENTGSVTYTDMLPDAETGVVEKEIRSSDDRKNGDTYVYNGGTISNRRRGTTTATASKSWDAAAFQSELGGVKVEFALQSRPTGAYGGPEEGWNPVADESGNPFTIEMEEFTAENLAERSETVSISKYGPLGRELEYRWVELGVYQKGEGGQYGENLLSEDGTFILWQDGREIRYHSEIEVFKDDADDGWITRLENTISNTIDYHVEKQWKNMDPDAEITLQLYLIDTDGQIKHPISGKEEPIYEFKLDGKPDAEPTTVTIDGFGSFTVQEGQQGEAAEEEFQAVWTADLSNLPQYDGQGRPYEYVLLEKSTSSHFPQYVTTRDEEGNYTTIVINGPGEGNQILVRKAWIDDGDDLHREAVTIGVYHKTETDPETDNPLRIAEATLRDGVWLVEVGIGEYEPEDVFLVEEKLGGEEIDFTGRLEHHGQEDEPHQYAEGVYHSYEVTYSEGEELAGMTCYTVTNRRLGNIDITVTKHWNDGEDYGQRIQEALHQIPEDEQPRLVLELQFDNPLEGYEIRPSEENDYYEITLGSDAIPIRDNGGIPNAENGGTPSTAWRKLNFNVQDKKYYFSYLPKYDLEGRVAHYTVVERWVDRNGNPADLADLAERSSNPASWQELLEVWNEYATTIRETGYAVADLHDRDAQAITVANYRTGSKTVHWEKLWQDAYAYENGQRPDLYLDLYRLTMNPDAKNPLTLYRSNYRWRPTAPQTDAGEGDDQRWHWYAEFTGLPRYDGEGYAYLYYAIEHTAVDAGQFDYAPAQYLMPGESELTKIGTVNAPLQGTGTAAGDWMYLIPADAAQKPEDAGKYLLREGGTFLNQLEGSALIQGDKLWNGLPAGYDREHDLPDVTFTVKQSLNGDVIAENIATLTIKSEDWAELQSAGRYRFTIQYQGANTVHTGGDGAISFYPEESSEDWRPLPKYSEDGELYTYTLSEEVTFAGEDGKTLPDGEVVFETVGNTFSFTNQYTTEKNRAEVAVQKHLYLPKGEDGNYVFPAVTFQLSRTYVKNGGSPSDSEIVSTITWSSNEIKTAWDGLSESDEQKKDGYVTGVRSFGEQEIYAPNGSIYTYTITEVKDNLAGFDTWAAAGNPTAEAVMDNGDQYKHIPTDESPNPQVTGITLKATAEGQDIPTIYATFANQRQEEQQKITAIQGTKLWKDFNNYFGLRKESFSKQEGEVENRIELTLYRYANSQPNQNNGIDEHEVENVTFQEDWYDDKAASPTKDPDNTLHSIWYYTFAAEGNGTDLEQYAPNGMPWIYVVKEELTGDLTYYEKETAEVELSAKEAEDGVLTLPELVNSLENTVSYSKTWVDSEGNPITEDVLGYPVTVEFRLDVAELEPVSGEGTYTIKDGNNGWKSASEYFAPDKGNISKDAFEAVFQGVNPSFSQTLEGYLGNAEVWGVTKTGPTTLPTAIRKPGDNGEVVQLIYRVVETAIYGTVDNDKQVNRVGFTIGPSDDGKTYTYKYTDETGENALFQPVYYPDGLGEKGSCNNFDTRNLYNTLNEAEFSMTKRWEGDSKNAYGTRPGTENGDYTWQTSFLIQRSTDNGASWEHVYGTTNDPQPLIVTLYGGNEDAEMSQTVPGLPKYDSAGKPYTYRARELSAGLNWVDTGDETVAGAIADIAVQGSESEYVLDDGDHYNTAYTVSYAGNGAVVNTLDTTKLYASKQWIRDGGLTTGVTFRLQYQNTSGNWVDVPASAGTVSLDGKADAPTDDVSYELAPDDSGRWMAVWEGLPLRMPGSLLADENSVTNYRIVETVEDGQGGKYLQEDEQGTYEVDGGSYDIWRFVNTQKTSFQVTKRWGLAAGFSPETVTVGIYRTTILEEVGQKDKDNEVLAASGDGQMTLNFQQAETQTVNNLPKYDANGDLYYYYAVELMIGDAAVPDPVDNSATVGSGSEQYDVHYTWNTGGQDVDHTTILNIGYQDLTITKHWKDNSNAYGTRPDNLILTLYRTPEGGGEETVNVEQPEWEKDKASNTWTLTYTGLPMADKEGNVYTYRVEEEKIEIDSDTGHYVLTGPVAGNGGFTLTNTLTGETELTVTKNWVDGGNADNTRPSSITVTLYQNGQPLPGETVEIKAPNVLQQLFGADSDQWSYTFTDLPKYDENGKEYVYTVSEEPVEGYEPAPQEGTAFTNTLLTSVQVEKIWPGVDEAAWKPVTVKLYRTVADNPTDADWIEVPESEGGGEKVINADSNWIGTYDGLDRFDADGNRYQFKVVETEIGDEPAEDCGYIIQYGEDTSAPGQIQLLVANIEPGTLTGSKTWMDNGNTYDTRPSELELILERTAVRHNPTEDSWETVSESEYTLTWDKTDTDLWTYTFDGFPSGDSEGNLYRYRVREEAIEPLANGDYYEETSGSDADYDFTNTLKGTVDIPVTKVWDDNNDAFGYRPESVALELYANGGENPVQTHKLSAPGLLARLLGEEENTWTYTFEDLPKYDDTGTLINYEVREVLEAETGERYAVTIYPESADGVTLPEDGFTVTNTGEGCLLVTKQVTGRRGNRGKDFTFTVTFTDPDENALTEDFPYEKTLQDGTVQTDEIASGGQFQLKDGESMRIDCLPGGTQYTVTESDNAGYRVTATGASGEIQAGVELTAAFGNYRGGGGGSDPDPDPDPKPHRDPDPPKPHQPTTPLPHTGQNWLLPLLLAAGGSVLIGTGVWMNRKKRRRDPHA